MTSDESRHRAFFRPRRHVIKGLCIRNHQFVSLPPSLLDRTLLHNSPLVHANPARRQVKLVEVAIVVGNHHDSRSGLHQVRQEFVIEFAPKFGILLGRPSVEQQNRALFEKADDEGEPPALTARQVERTELAVSQPGLVGKTKLGQQTLNLSRIWLGYPVKPLEQVIVEEDAGYQRTILIAREVVDQPAIEDDFTGIWRVEAGQHPQECRFSRAVAAGDEDQLPGVQFKVDRTDLECGLGKSVDIAKHDPAHLDLAKAPERGKLTWLDR